MARMDQERFSRIVTEHSGAVANYLRRRLYPLSVSDLDDLVEETMIVVWRRLNDVPPDAELAWTLGVARNVLRNARRARARRSAMEGHVRTPGYDASAEDHVLADAGVREALAALDDDERDIVLLNAWDGLDTHALAAYYAISTNAAAVRLSRAQRRFRDLLATADVG